MENENTAAEEQTQLQEKVTPVTITETESDPADAARSNDVSGDAQDMIIEQQQSTIDALLARTEQLTKQLNMLVAQGIQITDETPKAGQQQEPEPQPFEAFSDLGKQFGNDKPRKEV